jgi:GNAT superfamily N-acetyltransferase
MSIEVRELSGKKDLCTFIYLPEKIHKSHKRWVPPIYMDEWAFFSPKKNKSFSHCLTTLALAWDGNRPVGRIMGIINPQYNAIHNEHNARFFALECYQDLEIARALIDFVSSWAQENGMRRLVGPLGFSDKDPQGCQIEGFDEPVAITTPCNFTWMVDFYEALGFQKEVDLVSYKIIVPKKVPEYIERVSNRVIESNGYVLHEFKSRRKLRPWIVPVFRLVNITFTHIYGFIPLEEKEMQELANRYIPILDPRFVKVITRLDGELLAFAVSMPELSQGIKRARGRLFPFGWFHILRESRRTKMLTLLLGAVKEEHRGKGLDSLMSLRLLESAIKAGMKTTDSHLILEHNARMRAMCDRIDGKVYKRFRIFYKEL